MPNAFDASIVMWFDQFAQRWPLFDHVANAFEGESLLKCGVLTVFMWWAWFRDNSDKLRDRAVLIAGVAAAMVSLALCRGAAYLLPYRQRPIFNPSLHFRPPLFTNSADLISWSSFPSDHAGLCFALVAVVFAVSRRAGLLAFLYATFFICIPRIYVGDHYPTDILGGAFIGIAVVWLFERPAIRDRLARMPLNLLESAPARFYLIGYVASLFLATNFELVRKLGGLVFHSFRTHGSI
jgi:undecaprenyl-diphosphatase